MKVIKLDELFEARTIGAENKFILIQGLKHTNGFEIQVKLYNLGSDNYDTVIFFAKNSTFDIRIYNRKIFFLLDNRNGFEDYTNNFQFTVGKRCDSIKEGLAIINNILNKFHIHIEA